MVPLKLKYEIDPRYPDFRVARLVVDLQFAPALGVLPGTAFFDSAMLDSGAGYLIIPHKLHNTKRLMVFQELGQRPYRVSSIGSEIVLQRFVEIGVHCAVIHSDRTCTYWPEHFVKVQAYFLDANQGPKNKVLVGLDVLLEHFITHLEKDNSFLQVRP